MKACSFIRRSLSSGRGHRVFEGCGVGVNEAHFRERRKGRKGFGAAGKVVVFGMKSRDWAARMEVMHNVSSSSLIEAKGRKAEKGTMIYNDKFKSHNDLKAFAYRH